jgi:catalase
MWIMSDRALSFSMMQGFGVHTWDRAMDPPPV